MTADQQSYIGWLLLTLQGGIHIFQMQYAVQSLQCVVMRWLKPGCVTQLRRMAEEENLAEWLVEITATPDMDAAEGFASTYERCFPSLFHSSTF